MLINKLQDIRYNGKLKLGSFVFIYNIKLIINKVHYFFCNTNDETDHTFNNPIYNFMDHKKSYYLLNENKILKM